MVAAFTAVLGNLASAQAPAPSQSVGLRFIDQLNLFDDSGASISGLSLKKAAPWVLVVLDANREASVRFASLFKSGDTVLTGDVLLVIIGNEVDVARLIARQKKPIESSAVRVLRDGTGSVVKELALSGTPVMIGIRPDNSVGWFRALPPVDGTEFRASVAAWVKRSAGSIAK